MGGEAKAILDEGCQFCICAEPCAPRRVELVLPMYNNVNLVNQKCNT
eukprot:NODE_8983_length_235_cov_89.204301_g7823_i0.p2 GENE.NODE_8983_length_235_cov_89.204301_g7823_i0~~NODE_8983_length_235_cov_89.204301_g7823_i0.p2  ORF type:complete len:57 (-),score=25.15 NODE_8983_length_235_cov_89.204301_g7823_i0:63-203(-)